MRGVYFCFGTGGNMRCRKGNPCSTRAKGNNIHGVGIEPDVVCEFDGDAYYDEDVDNQLEKALEVLEKGRR